MAEKKRKTRDSSNSRKFKGGKKSKKDEKRGPRLPSSLRREVAALTRNPTHNNNNSSEEEEEEIELNDLDLYECEEAIPEEESRKNRRYDHVDNLEYQLPEEFEDEDLSSDESGDDDDNNERHKRMLQGITGMPPEAFEPTDKRNLASVVSEAYPESEYNPVPLDGRISINDLLNPLQNKRRDSSLRKRIRKLENQSAVVQTPLSKSLRENVERKVAYEHSKKDITKWEPLVKRNREAPTIFFDEDIDIGFSTVGAIASDFRPRTEFEKKIDSLVRDSKVVEAHKEDGARLLELNKISVEDVKDRQNRLAKMRSLLFRHEMKAKHIKKIKSKTYHRLQKKSKEKAAYAETQTDPETAKELAIKQEFKRAEERMTLKHKNTSKWAKYNLKRPHSALDEGTRVAIAEQLHQHAELTRKINSMNDSSSSDESSDSDDDGELSPGTEHDGASKLLTTAKEKTIKAIEMEDEMPESGVLSLPFMVRGLKKRKDEAYAEAKLALEDYESSLKQLEDTDEAEFPKVGTLSSSGRRVFGAIGKKPEESQNRMKNHNDSDSDSDSEHQYSGKDDVDTKRADNGASQEVHVDASMLYEESDFGRASVLKGSDDTNSDPGPKTTYDVAIFASNSWKKMGSNNVKNKKEGSSPAAVKLPVIQKDLKEVYDDEDTESEEEMVDGILSSGTKPVYELPSQEELLRRAFAGDDVEEEFEKDKLEVLSEENPEPEKPVLVPGWGQWTDIQKKKGMPSWMLEEHESAKKKREDDLKKRKDAHLKHVIISEKISKKADTLHTKTLPFPFTSKEVFEQSIRVPIGPEFNPATSVGALIRPAVMKKPGVIIKPIKFEEINPHDREDEHKSKGKNQKNNNKSSSGKATKKMKTSRRAS